MISRLRTVLTILMVLLSAHAIDANAAVIVDDATIAPFGSDQLLTLTRSIPDNGGWFAIEIESLGSSQFRFSAAGIAEVYGLFTVAIGATFDPAFVLSNDPIVSNHPPFSLNSVQTFGANQSKFFGYWDDRNGNAAPDANDNYGWVQITRTPFGLEATSSATAVGGGIIVGATTQVPEPTPAALASVGLLLLLVLSKVVARTRTA